MVPFKRPAADKSGIPVYQPGTTYQQLMQLQQPFVPVSCEYPISSSSTSTSTCTSTSTLTATTLIPPHTSTATLNANANNNHNFVNQNSVNNNNSGTAVNSNGIVSPTSTANNNNNNITTLNKEQNISSSSNSVTVTSNHVSTGTNVVTSNHFNNTNGIESDKDSAVKKSIYNTSAHDNASSTSLNNAVVNTSVSVTPVSTYNYANTLTANSAYNAAANAALQSHALSLAYSMPQSTYTPASYFTTAQTNALYSNPAAIAKEVAQKNYANALKLAAASNALTGKPLSALTYSTVNFNKPALLPQPHYHATPQLTSPRPALAAPFTSNRIPTAASINPNHSAIRPGTQLVTSYSRPQTPILTQNPYAQFLRPQSQASPYGQNPFAAQAAMAANQQLMFYHGLTHGYPTAQMGFPTGVPSSLSSAVNPTYTQNALTGIPTISSMQGVSQAGAANSAVVLNPYKKMKTS